MNSGWKGVKVCNDSSTDELAISLWIRWERAGRMPVLLIVSRELQKIAAMLAAFLMNS